MSHHEHTHHPNVSADLVWEIVRNNNAFLVKRKTGGGAYFSRDPLNLTNIHSRKNAGFVNDKGVGIIPGEKGAITLTTKKTKHQSRPAAILNTTTFKGNTSGPKVYKNIVNTVAKQGYRADLRREAVARASALKKAAQPKKDAPEKKSRGKKAAAKAE